MNTDDYILHNIDGFKIYTEKQDLYFQQAKENYERAFRNFYEEFLDKTKNALDIGSNIGFHTIFMSQKAKKVVAVDADREMCEVLKENLKLNNITNVEVINAVVDEEDKNETEFWVSRYARSQSTKFFHDFRSKEKIVVQSITGDTIVKEYFNNEPIHLIKIDVEGYELEVLKGLKKTLEKNNCVVAFEWNHELLQYRKIKSEDILNLLESFGFKYFYLFLTSSRLVVQKDDIPNYGRMLGSPLFLASKERI